LKKKKELEEIAQKSAKIEENLLTHRTTIAPIVLRWKNKKETYLQPIVLRCSAP
jgi:hypothetical protein